jgi:hypothetical protein
MANRDNLVLLRMVHAGILVSLLWKSLFYIGCVLIYDEIPIFDPFFPNWLRSLLVAELAYAAAIAASVAILFSRSRQILMGLSLTTLVAMVILSIHQLSYNDVTFFCCAWTSLWSVWFATRVNEPFKSVFPRAVWLTHLILSTIFIGAAIGKLTPGYWSGQVLYEIYFVDRDFWTYNLLRSWFDQDALRAIAKGHSQMVIVSELICGFLWLMPARLASAMAVIMLSGIALTNNALLFSVVSCLLALALVGLHQPRSPAPNTQLKQVNLNRRAVQSS